HHRPVDGSFLLRPVAGICFDLGVALGAPPLGLLTAREGRLGGILVVLPLLVGVLNACAGYTETSPFFVPLLLLSAVGVSAAFWFLPFCIGHLLAQDRPVLFKVFWVVLLLLGNLIVVPLYWYIFVWRPHLALASRRQI